MKESVVVIDLASDDSDDNASNSHSGSIGYVPTRVQQRENYEQQHLKQVQQRNDTSSVATTVSSATLSAAPSAMPSRVAREWGPGAASSRRKAQIVMIYDESLRRCDPAIVAGIKEIFLQFSCSSMTLNRWPEPMQTLTNENSNSNASAPVSDIVRYPFCEVTTLGSNIIQWSRKPSPEFLPTADYASVSPLDWKRQFDSVGYEPFRLYVAENVPFLKKIIQSSDGIEFMELEEFIRNKLFEASNSSGEMPLGHRSADEMRYILALVDIDKDVLDIQRQVNSVSGVSCDVQRLLDSASTYLMYECGVEVVSFKKGVQFVEYLSTLTRLVKDRSPVNAISEIDFVNKVSREKPPEHMLGREREAFELRQIWASMLQMLPMMSKEKAAVLTSKADYSCPSKLFEVYRTANKENATAIEPQNVGLSAYGFEADSAENSNTSTAGTGARRVQEKKRKKIQDSIRLLVQEEFGELKNGTKRKEAKLAKHVHNMCTSIDPDLCLSSIS